MTPAREKTVRFASWIMQEGFTGIPNVVLLDSDLSPVAVRLYGLLAYYARLTEEAWPGQTLLTERCNASERSMRTGLRQLEDRHLVETRRQGQGRTNVYILLDPEPSSDRQYLPVKSGKGCRTGSADVAGPDRQPVPILCEVDAVEVQQRLESADADSTLLTSAGAQAGNNAATPDSIERARELYATLSSLDEKSVLWSMVAVAKARGLERGWNPEKALALVRGDYRNRAFADEADRFRAFYSPGGEGENRPFKNLVLRWEHWLKRAPTLDTVVAQRNGRGRRGAGPQPTSRELAAKLGGQPSRDAA